MAGGTASATEVVEHTLDVGAFSVEKFVESFPALVEAASGTHSLKEMVLTMAFSGRLLPHSEHASPAEEILTHIDKARSERRREALPSVSSEETPTSPPHWAWLRLGNIADVVGGVTKGRDLKGRKRIWLPYLRVANVQRGFLDLSEMKEIEVAEDELPKYQLRPGDVLFTEGGDWDKLGRSAVWDAQIKPCIHQNHVFRARFISPQLDPAWFSAFANSPAGRNYFQNAAKRTTNLASINMTQLRNCPMPLPPLAEQKRIVARVDQLMALIDHLEAKQNRKRDLGARFTKASLEALTTAESPQALTTAWTRIHQSWPTLLDHADKVAEIRATAVETALRGCITQRLSGDGDVSVLLAKLDSRYALDVANTSLPFVCPRTWAWCALGQLVDPAYPISYGVLVPGPDVPDGVPFVRIQDLSVSAPPATPTKRIAARIAAQYSRTTLRGGEILLGVVGSIGKVGLAPASWAGAAIARAVCRIVCHPEIDSRYLAWAIQSRTLQTYFLETTRTLAQPTLNVGMIRSAPVPLPPLPEQKRIVAKVEHLMKLCDILESALRRSEDRAAKLAEAVVQEMVA